MVTETDPNGKKVAEPQIHRRHSSLSYYYHFYHDITPNYQILSTLFGTC